MVAYSFKGRFGEPILAKTKRQTIRAPRKRHARPGEELQLYTGMRTRHCKLLMRPICEAVKAVEIEVGPMHIGPIWVNGCTITDLDAFARDDGFSDAQDMHQFWLEEHGAGRFDGVLIAWDPDRQGDAP